MERIGPQRDTGNSLNDACVESPRILVFNITAHDVRPHGLLIAIQWLVGVWLRSCESCEFCSFFLGLRECINLRDTIANTGFRLRYVGRRGFTNYVRIDPMYDLFRMYSDG